VKSLIFLLLVTTFSSVASNFSLRSSSAALTNSSIELLMNPEGQTLYKVIAPLTISSMEVSIRILHPLDKNTNLELLKYYERQMPNELKDALGSKGNLHNPALKPLIEEFAQAIRDTEFFAAINRDLGRLGYFVNSVNFEKFFILDGHFYVAEINLTCNRET
jgi:hypothetical protein